MKTRFSQHFLVVGKRDGKKLNEEKLREILNRKGQGDLTLL